MDELSQEDIDELEKHSEGLDKVLESLTSRSTSEVYETPDDASSLLEEMKNLPSE